MKYTKINSNEFQNPMNIAKSVFVEGIILGVIPMKNKKGKIVMYSGIIGDADGNIPFKYYENNLENAENLINLKLIKLSGIIMPADGQNVLCVEKISNRISKEEKEKLTYDNGYLQYLKGYAKGYERIYELNDIAELDYDFAWTRVFDRNRNFNSNKVGKWMYFFNNERGIEETDDFLFEIAKNAIKNKICRSVKYSTPYCNDTGVMCFYTEIDNTEEHKKIIQYLIDNDLIRKTKTEKYYNIAFKMDNQTKNNEYGEDFEDKLKLSEFIDLETGKFIK